MSNIFTLECFIYSKEIYVYVRMYQILHPTIRMADEENICLIFNITNCAVRTTHEAKRSHVVTRDNSKVCHLLLAANPHTFLNMGVNLKAN